MYRNHQNLRRVARPKRKMRRVALTGLAVGTSIMTCKGERVVEDLRPGDVLMTKDAGAQPVLALSHRDISLMRQPQLAPILFEHGSIAPDFPSASVYLDPMQMIVIKHDLFETCFERREILAMAGDLVSLAGGRQVVGNHDVSMVFLTLDAAHLVYCENMVLSLGCQDEMPLRPIVTGADLCLALSILRNRMRPDHNQGFPLH